MSEEGSWGPVGLLRSAPELAVCGGFFEFSPGDAGDWVSWTGMG